MKRRNTVLWSGALVAAAWLAATTAAVGQQKYRLRDTESVGDQVQIDSSAEGTIRMQISSTGRPPQLLSVANRNQFKYSQQVLAVDRKGPSAVRRTYTVARRVQTDPTGSPVEKVSPLQGKTLEIRRQGGKVAITPAKVKLPPQDRSLISVAVTVSELEFYPDREVAPGEEWTVDPKLITSKFPGMYSADVKYQFLDVVSFGGRPCARLRVSMEMSGQTGTMPVPTTMKMVGEVYHALDLKRPLLMTYSGPMTFKGDQDRNGILISITGEGTITAKETYRWLKVRGKAVAAKG